MTIPYSIPPGKWCPECQQMKPKHDFTLNRQTKDGRAAYCKPCRALHRKHKYPEDKDYSHRKGVEKRYGISYERYEAMSQAQGGCCAICGRTAKATTGRGKRLQVDHCHDSGAIRSLLCNACNNGLGHFADDANRLEAAIKYLKKHS